MVIRQLNSTAEKDNSNTILEANIINPYQGLKYAAIGDSITYGYIPRNAPGYPGQLKSYAALAAEKLGMSFYNGGISDSTVANRNPYSYMPMCDRFNDLPNDADVITIMGGTNDIRNDIPLGNMDDRGKETYYGALHIILSGLIKKYMIDGGVELGSRKKIVICTPIKLLKASSLVQGGTGILYSWDDWIDAIKKVASYYGIPVLDFYNTCSINPHLHETVKGWQDGYTGFYNPYITDGTHPTQEGAEIMADRLVGFLRSLK